MVVYQIKRERKVIYSSTAERKIVTAFMKVILVKQ